MLDFELARPATKTPPPPPVPKAPRRKPAPKGQGGRATGWRIKPEAYEKVREIAEETRIPQTIIVELIIGEFHRRWKEAPEGTVGDPIRRLICIPVNSRPPADGPPEEGST